MAGSQTIHFADQERREFIVFELGRHADQIGEEAAFHAGVAPLMIAARAASGYFCQSVGVPQAVAGGRAQNESLLFALLLVIVPPMLGRFLAKLIAASRQRFAGDTLENLLATIAVAQQIVIVGPEPTPVALAARRPFVVEVPRLREARCSCPTCPTRPRRWAFLHSKSKPMG